MQNYYLWQAALVVGLCALSSPVFAQERNPQSPRVEQMPSAPREQTQTEADHTLAERIRQALQENAPLSSRAQNIQITVAKGEVTLQGEVKTAEERDGVESQVRQIQGVEEVQNRLRLAGRDKESAARGPSEHE